MSEKKSANRELLNAVRSINDQLEELPIHTHQKAIEALIVLGNHRLASAQQEHAEAQRQAEMNRAFGLDDGAGSRLIT